MSGFEFATASRIIFGEGKFAETAEIALSFGKRILLVTGNVALAVAAGKLSADLKGRGASVTTLEVAGEPTIGSITEGMAQAREHGCDVLIGLGGGSTMDTAKCLSGLLANEGELLDYLEVVGKGKALQRPALPCICIPTTAGTGAEVTRNAVIGATEQRVKASIRSPYLLPRVALVDPELTYDLPAEVTAYTGLDAFTQLLEALISKRANTFSMMISREGLRTIHLLKVAYESALAPDSHPRAERVQARGAMAYNSLLGGLALANAGLGAVHGFAAVLGARYPIPHGACCGLLLPYVVRANSRARNGDTHSDQLPVIGLASTWIGERPGEQAFEALDSFVGMFNLPRLSTYGVQKSDLPELVQLSKRASSMKGNPVELTDEELAGILSAAL